MRGKQTKIVSEWVCEWLKDTHVYRGASLLENTCDVCFACAVPAPLCILTNDNGEIMYYKFHGFYIRWLLI